MEHDSELSDPMGENNIMIYINRPDIVDEGGEIRNTEEPIGQMIPLENLRLNQQLEGHLNDISYYGEGYDNFYGAYERAMRAEQLAGRRNHRINLNEYINVERPFPVIINTPNRPRQRDPPPKNWLLKLVRKINFQCIAFALPAIAVLVLTALKNQIIRRQ
ncbi:uncharacterized protein LOC119669426 [Teleopsis dalmanni]|uniref:uncharacterized protein LOC119669426 n=1 Tax=Teleopsis dalmanni TaxID=139649 RepID=UPI0018CE20C1|nr:uncharacterized protein LOC119669426 [Teleopsis dalmanni]XP_037935244.1 uncharacterized protein LOC119669426 [Teleopsis dalmanni]